MQGQGRGVAHNVVVDSGGTSGGDMSKSYAARPVYGYGLNPASAAISANYGYRYGYGYGYGYGDWAFGLPLLPLPPLLGNTLHGRGKSVRPVSTPLGVQGGGILKKLPQSGFVQGRVHARGYASGGRFLGGGRGRNLTKEALDADLEEWRLKDKRFAGHSLDAELDDYWSKKENLNSEASKETGK